MLDRNPLRSVDGRFLPRIDFSHYALNTHYSADDPTSISIKPQPKIPSELVQLRNEFVKATNEYKQSLMRLKTIYEQNVVKAEQKLEVSRKLLSENLIPQSQVEENEAALKHAQDKVVDTANQIAKADEEIARALDDAKLNAEYKQAVAQRRKERKPRCANWTLTAYRRETAKSIEMGFRLVCR